MQPIEISPARSASSTARTSTRPDHAQAVPQAGRAHRLRRVPLLRLGEGARLGAAGEPDPRRRARTSVRLLARARPWGARRIRLPGDRRAELRRHLLLQLHEDRAACRSCCRRSAAARSRRPARAQVDLRAQEVRYDGPTAGSSACPSRSTRRSAGACSRGSTTSASRSASTSARSPPTKASASSGRRRSRDDGAVSTGARERSAGAARLGRRDLPPRGGAAGSVGAGDPRRLPLDGRGDVLDAGAAPAA